MNLGHLESRFENLFFDALVVSSHRSTLTEQVTLGSILVLVSYCDFLVLAKMNRRLESLLDGYLIVVISTGGSPDAFEAF